MSKVAHHNSSGFTSGLRRSCLWGNTHLTGTVTGTRSLTLEHIAFHLLHIFPEHYVLPPEIRDILCSGSTDDTCERWIHPQSSFTVSERQYCNILPSKQAVAGSGPVSRSSPPYYILLKHSPILFRLSLVCYTERMTAEEQIARLEEPLTHVLE